MPATFAHPVFAVPLARWKLPLSALVYGSMAPDCAYLIPGHIPQVFRHNLAGLFLFALPVGLILLWVHHRLIKNAIGELLPRRLQAKLTTQLAPFDFGPLPRFALISAAVVAGAATHLFIDEFTHYRGIQHFQILGTVIIDMRPEPIRLYRMLQYGTSVAGTAILLYWMRNYLRDLLPAKGERRRLARGLAIFAAAALIAFAYALFEARDQTGFRALQVFSVRFAGGVMAASFAGLILYGLKTRLRA